MSTDFAKAARRRFYADAAVTEDFGLVLDGRPVRTPRKAVLVLPTRALAEAVRTEWLAQGTSIEPATMPLTRLANTAIDRVAPDVDRIAAEIVEYAASDLVCYRAAGPADLIGLEALAWDPILAWAARRLEAGFATTTAILHQPQPPASLDRLRAWLTIQSPWLLTPIHNIATLTGSALLAVMTVDGDLPPDVAWAAAHVDEDWQISQWGQDEEAAARRRSRLAEFQQSVRFARLSRTVQ